jgi:ABC-type Fe3+-hydroxamate transport system substrate-binding protein
VEGLQQFEKNHAIIPTPSSMEELLIQFHTLEELLGPDPGFSRLQSEITQRLQGLSDKLKERFGERIPTILEWTPDGRIGGPESLLGVLVRLAGATFPELQKESDQWGWWTIDKEELRLADPDYLLLPDWFWGDSGRAKLWLEEVTNDPFLRPMTAFQTRADGSNGLIQIPEAFKSSSNQNLIRGIESLQAQLFPEFYPEDFFPAPFGRFEADPTGQEPGL